MLTQLYHYACQLRKVIDGDTVDVAIDLGFDTLILRRVRMVGINTPEKHGETRAMGDAATAHLQLLLSQPGELRVISHEVEKFGRVLGTLILQKPDGTEIDINRQMVQDGHALAYDGGKRSDADFLTEEFRAGQLADPADESSGPAGKAA